MSARGWLVGLAWAALAVIPAVPAAGATGGGPSEWPVRVVRPRVRTLPNGLRVVLFPRPGLPVVQLQLQVAAGERAEAPGQDGLAYLTAQMLRQGTTSRSAADFATELDTLGATLAVSVTRDVAQIAAGCRVAEFESTLEVMSDAVINPLFSDEAFQLVRRQVAGQLGVQAQNPVLIADERATALGFGVHPYGHAARGTLASLLGSNRNQVREFHRDRWRPDDAVLAIAGDIDPERAFGVATEWFGRWTGTAAAEPTRAVPAARKGVFLLDLPGSPATEVRALLPAPGRGSPDYPGWVVLREALEGGLLPAGAHAVLSGARDASLLLVSATARPESAAVTATRLRNALRAATTTPPSGDALAGARKRAAQGWTFTVESLGQLLSSWLAGDAAGLPVEHLAGAAAALGAATPPALGAAGRDVTLLLAGPADRMKAVLPSLGRIDTLRDEEHPMAARIAPVTPEQRRRGRQLIDAAVAAHGGQAKLKAVHTSELDGEMSMAVGGRDMTGESRYLRQDPARLVFITRLLDFEHRQVLDGARGWALSQAGDSASLMPADSTTLLGLRAILESDLVHLLRTASDSASDVASVGEGGLGGKTCDRVEFTTPVNGRARLWLDTGSHRVVAVELQPTPQGDWRDRREWSDYFQVEGIWWPRRELHELDGEKVMTTTLRRVVVNGAVDSSLFRRPIVIRGEVRGLE